MGDESYTSHQHTTWMVMANNLPWAPVLHVASRQDAPTALSHLWQTISLPKKPPSWLCRLSRLLAFLCSRLPTHKDKRFCVARNYPAPLISRTHTHAHTHTHTPGWGEWPKQMHTELQIHQHDQGNPVGPGSAIATFKEGAPNYCTYCQGRWDLAASSATPDQAGVHTLMNFPNTDLCRRESQLCSHSHSSQDHAGQGCHCTQSCLDSQRVRGLAI